MNSRILGIDIGATTIKFGAVDAQGQVSDRGVEPVCSESNAALVEQLVHVIARFEFRDISQIGIGSPGPLDIDQGTIVTSANMPAIKDLALVSLLQKKFPERRIMLDNDANAATLGEKYFGLGRGVSDFAVFTLGTGVGGGCIFEGKLKHGIGGNFFEVGHIPIAAYQSTPNARRCGCGNLGCLESYASATGISLSYKEATSETLTAHEIAKLADRGDPHAKEAYIEAARALAVGAAIITQLMNITHFIFTGGVAAARNLLEPALVQTYKEHTFSMFHAMAKFAFTQGDENAGILGAAALFRA